MIPVVVLRVSQDDHMMSHDIYVAIPRRTILTVVPVARDW